MKAVLIANCQIDGVARCLSVMAPELRIHGINPGDLRVCPEAHQAAIAAADFVFVQTHRAVQLFRETFPEAEARAIVFPRVYFAGYHPDSSYQRDERDELIPPVEGLGYHSRIVFAAFQLGLAAERTVPLFNRETFEAAGYLDAWEPAAATFLSEASESDCDMSSAPNRWSRRGCFMHSINHPKLHVLADIAHALLTRVGVRARTPRPERYARDRLRELATWPLYPEIAARHGLEGDYCFKRESGELVDLESVVRMSFDGYSRVTGFQDNAEAAAMRKLIAALAGSWRPQAKTSAPAPTFAKEDNPYSAIPSQQVWRLAVADVPRSEVDPVWPSKFTLTREDKVATFGSCFAQHISRRLQHANLGYFVTEAAPSGTAESDALARSFGVFSARYGNIYTARQLSQLIERAYDPRAYAERSWTRPDGRLVDPFRPAIEPEGFASESDMQASRAAHLERVRELVEGLDVLVFTLGLTEGWRSKETGAVFPVAPGVAAGKWDREQFEFVNFTKSEVVADTMAALKRVRSINPKARAILTVSPVPLIATYERRHVLVATSASKSILRTAVDEIVRSNDWASYFPSYEIVSAPYTRGAYFESNLRGVTEAGIDHVMRLFLRHLYGIRSEVGGLMSGYDVVCEEELLDGEAH